MRKFAKVQEWFLVEDAAKYLSIVFDEEITEAHVLRLALERRLRLSIDFVETAKVKYGAVVQCTQVDIDSALAAGAPHPDLDWRGLPPQEVATHVAHPPEEAEGKPALGIRSLKIGDDLYVTFRSSKVRTVEGVWDLPMIGGERIDIEERYQQLTNRGRLDLTAIEGCIVEDPNGQLCQLQEALDVTLYTRAWNTELAELKQRIVDDNLGGAEAEALLAYYQEERKKFVEIMKLHPASEFYYPAGRLPKNSRLVVRTDALREFEQAAFSNGRDVGKADVLAGSGRTTALKIIGGLVMKGYGMNIHAERLERIGELVKDLEIAGAAVTEKTLRVWIKEAANIIEPPKARP